MSFIYIHLSDIHFGQEKGGQVIVNNDVKDELIRDARSFLTEQDLSANGIIISGDIAFAGTQAEYDHAGAWLDRLTAAAGCERTAVQLVPGNHDIDLSKIGIAGQNIIDDILQNGDAALNKYLDSETDRELLYQKFAAYRIFAEAYDCPLDSDGNVLNHRVIEIAPNKFLKFHGVNTALLCSKNKTEEGKLLLGQRQRVIPNTDNVEVIVIAHHPLNWIQDSEDALKYLKNRARIFITGHEHQPEHNIDEVDKGVHFLSIASGAAVPPRTNDQFTYCYNILQFEWDEAKAKLCVIIHPRRWDDDHKKFVEDEKNFQKDKCKFLLKCPNFETKTKKQAAEAAKLVVSPIASGNTSFVETVIESNELMTDSQDQILLLRFFRELSSTQRLSALIELQAFPAHLTEPVNHTIETKAVRNLLSAGKAEQLKTTIDLILSTKLDPK